MTYKIQSVTITYCRKKSFLSTIKQNHLFFHHTLINTEKYIGNEKDCAICVEGQESLF